MEPYIESLLGENEEVLLIARQHWFLLIVAIIGDILFFLAIIIGVNYLHSYFISNSIIPLVNILLIIPVVSLFKDALEWKSRFYIVTNRRILQTVGIINKSEIDSSLEKLNDAKMYQSLLGRLMGYGDIQILTGSELGVNLFRRINDPVLFKMTIMNARENLSKERQEKLSSHTANVSTIIEEMEQLKSEGVISEEVFQVMKKDTISKL